MGAKLLNTNLDEISAAIGYTATNLLVVWYGGQWLRVPGRADENSPLGKLIGGPALRALVRTYGGQNLWVNQGEGIAREIRNRKIAGDLRQGKAPADIAREVGCRRRRVLQIRQDLIEKGVLDA